MKKVIILTMLAICFAGATKAYGLSEKLREFCKIYISEKDETLIYCHNKWVPISQVKDAVKEYVTNIGGWVFEEPSIGMLSQKYAVIALQTDRGVTYGTYFAVQNEISKAYTELRNEFALAVWSCTYNQLNRDQQKIACRVYPIVVSDTEPRLNHASYR